MTGESVPDAREQVGALPGTVLTPRHGVGGVVSTGASALGRIAAMVWDESGRRRFSGGWALSRQLVFVTSPLCLVVGGLAVPQGESWTRAAVLAVSLGVAAVPESLPAVVTISFALGAFRMARRHAVVRQLPAVETLGSVTVLASDKTGTMTSGVLTVRRVWSPEGACEIPARRTAWPGTCRDTAARAGTNRLLRDAALCNDASLVGTTGASGADGDPFDVALLVAAAKAGSPRGRLKLGQGRGDAVRQYSG